MALHLKREKDVGAVGGRVVMVRRRIIDPDFFLSMPINIADLLTNLTGYIFLDVVNGPRHAEFITSFYMLRILKYSEVLVQYNWALPYYLSERGVKLFNLTNVLSYLMGGHYYHLKAPKNLVPLFINTGIAQFSPPNRRMENLLHIDQFAANFDILHLNESVMSQIVPLLGSY